MQMKASSERLAKVGRGQYKSEGIHVDWAIACD